MADLRHDEELLSTKCGLLGGLLRSSNLHQHVSPYRYIQHRVSGPRVGVLVLTRGLVLMKHQSGEI